MTAGRFGVCEASPIRRGRQDKPRKRSSMSTDLRIDLGEARSALANAARRTAELLGSIDDPALAVHRSTWNVGEVGAHLAVALSGFTDAARGDYGAMAPFIPPTGLFADRLSAVTAGSVAAETERDPQVLGRLIVQRADGFVESTAALSDHERIATPWYGDGASLSVAAATAMLVGEQILHGYDVAVALGRSWPISVMEAHLILRGITSMMPLAANPKTTAGLRVSYRVTVRRGGPRFVVRVDDGSLTVEPANDQRVDCCLSADPVTLVLMGYGRIGQWGPMARGRIGAWGRQPWLALRFAELFFNP